MAVITELKPGESAGLGLGHNADLPPKPKRKNAATAANKTNVTPLAKEKVLPKKVNEQIVSLVFQIALFFGLIGSIIVLFILYLLKGNKK
jgi:hypothetical protein